MVLKTLFLLMFIGANFLVAGYTSFVDQLQDISEDEAPITPRTQNFQNRMENGHSIFTSNTKENLKEVLTEEEEPDVNQVVHRDDTTIKEIGAEYMEERVPTLSTVNSGTITEEEKFEIDGENKSGNLFNYLFRVILIRYIETLKKELRRRHRNEQIYKQFKKEKDQILPARTVKREKGAADIQEFEDKVILLKLFKIRKKRSSDGIQGSISETHAHDDDSSRLEKMLAEENNQLTDQTVESLDFTENQMEEEIMENADWSLGKETPKEQEEVRNENASFSTNIRRRKRNAKKDESEEDDDNEDDSDEDGKAKKKKKNRGKNIDQEAKSKENKKDDGTKEKTKKKIKEDGKYMDDEELDIKDKISEENIFDDDTADIKEGTDYDEKEIKKNN